MRLDARDRAGALTLVPEYGLNRGAIQVNAGTVNFKANSDTLAMFGPLTVANGAIVNVGDSPAANRHGVQMRFIDYFDKDSHGLYNTFKTSTHAQIESNWANTEFATIDYMTSASDYEANPGFNFAAYARAICVLHSNVAEDKYVFYSIKGIFARVDGDDTKCDDALTMREKTEAPGLRDAIFGFSICHGTVDLGTFHAYAYASEKRRHPRHGREAFESDDRGVICGCPQGRPNEMLTQSSMTPFGNSLTRS